MEKGAVQALKKTKRTNSLVAVKTRFRVVLVIKWSAGRWNVAEERKIGKGGRNFLLGDWNVDLKGVSEKVSRILEHVEFRGGEWMLGWFFQKGCVGSFWKSPSPGEGGAGAEVFTAKRQQPPPPDDAKPPARPRASWWQEVSNLKCKLRRIFGISRRRNGREIKM